MCVRNILWFLLSIYTLYAATAQNTRLHSTKNYYIFVTGTQLNIEKETILKRATRSLLEELNSISIKKNSEAVIESRATHVIDSAINLLKMIRENYDPEDAYELERRLLNSIKGSDPNKFVRGIRKLRDQKEVAKGLKIIEGDLKDDE
jgi:hypothetical protein